MKYSNPENTAVTLIAADGNEWTVPRGHRFWSEWGIDDAEAHGEIQPADETTLTTETTQGA